jgi:diaminohydroxyphosphoribosylaminopyrimidine deaminase / 5-amino-6-(5-phosphoribosylamino)uracil reductase
VVAATDETHMRRALDLARRGWGAVSPNPMVGAVVLRDREVVGEGWYRGPKGEPHAEIHALRQAGDAARGSTLVCTLEPCDHQASTPPCTHALIQAGIARVVVATRDPNPMVDGRGIERLRRAGIEVETGVLEHEAIALNVAFERHARTGRPFVVLKMASSLDGKTAARDGSSRWITGEAARADVHRLRAWSDAIVVGSSTAIADDPHLTVRGPQAASARRPLRVVVDSSGRVPPTLHLFDDAAATLVATTDRAPGARIDEWTAAGAQVALLDRDADGRVCLTSLVDELGKRDVQGLLLEGGPSLAWSAVREGLVDRIVCYLAPLLVGGSTAPTVLAGSGFAPIGDALRLGPFTVETLDPDLKVVADVHGHR